MFNKFSFCFLVAVVASFLLLSSTSENNGVDAAFKSARWVRPTAHSPQGDRRYLMQKHMKQIVKDARVEDPIPKEQIGRRKSRLYHLNYGPIYPQDHSHLKNQDKWYPLDHQLYY